MTWCHLVTCEEPRYRHAGHMLKQPMEELELAVFSPRKSFNLYTRSGSRSICLPKSDTSYWPQVWRNSSPWDGTPDIGSRSQGAKRSLSRSVLNEDLDMTVAASCIVDPLPGGKKDSTSLHLCCNAASQLGQDMPRLLRFSESLSVTSCLALVRKNRFRPMAWCLGPTSHDTPKHQWPPVVLVNLQATDEMLPQELLLLRLEPGGWWVLPWLAW